MNYINKRNRITEGLRKSFRNADCKMANRICYGYTTAADGELAINEVEANICNEKYAGAVMLQKTYVDDFFTGKQKKNVGQFQRYLYKNNHEPIVPWSVFERVQRI